MLLYTYKHNGNSEKCVIFRVFLNLNRNCRIIAKQLEPERVGPIQKVKKKTDT